MGAIYGDVIYIKWPKITKERYRGNHEVEINLKQYNDIIFELNI